MNKGEELRRKLKAAQTTMGYNNMELATKMHMSLAQLNRRLMYPNSIKVFELARFEKVLNVELLELSN